MDILKREIAPITKRAWELIDETAKEHLGACLTARKALEIEGPYGWDYSSVSLGSLQVSGKASGEAMEYGIRKVLPLMETRAFFELKIWDLDNINRGGKDANIFEPLRRAAENIGQFEEKSILYGYQEGGIQGFKDACPYEPISMSHNEEDILKKTVSGLEQLLRSGIEGPYFFIAGKEMAQALYEEEDGKPVKDYLEEIINGKILINSFVNDSFLFSGNKKYFRIILGQDLSIGYHSHNAEKAKLYFTESFTFRVINPRAAVYYKVS